MRKREKGRRKLRQRNLFQEMSLKGHLSHRGYMESMYTYDPISFLELCSQSWKLVEIDGPY